MANGYGAGLKKVKTFRDMSRSRPSSARRDDRPTPWRKQAPPDPKGNGAQGNGAQGNNGESPTPTPLPDMSVETGYKDPAFGDPTSLGQPRAPSPPPSMFDQRGSQRSPFFNTPLDFEGDDEGDDEGEPQYVEGAGPPAQDQIETGGLGGLGGFGDLGKGLAGFGLGGDDFEEEGRGRGQHEAEGALPEGSYYGPDAPEQGQGQAQAEEDIDELDVEFDKLNDQLLEGQENAKENIDAAFAKAQRRQASMLSLMGTSVSGREQGATAQTTLDYIQQMTNMYADFQNRSTELQLQWLDRKEAAKQRGIEAERQESLALIEYLLNSDQEVPDHLWEKAHGSEAETAKDAITGGGEGEAGEDGAVVTTGEPGSLKNEAGDFLMGPEGMGTSGATQADPWDQEGESHQWFARFTGDTPTATRGRYEYYRLDEDGNEVLFRAGADGGRFPGDVRLGAKFGGSGWGGKPRAGGGGYWAADQGGSWTSHRDSGYDVPEGDAIDFLNKMADRFGYDDHVEMFGQGATGNWKVDYDNANLGGGQLGDVEYDSEGGFFRGDNLSIPAFIEIMQYISLFQAQNDGMEPADDEIFAHLMAAGVLPSGTPASNPFTDVMPEEI